jgi:enoyl-[acyl-carrier protein] reductase II
MLNKKQQALCDVLAIQFPIIQAGMVWVSGAKLAAASAEAGVMGLIGAGSMKPDLLREHLKKAHTLSTKKVGVNIPLLYKDVEAQLEVCLEEGVDVFFTSAGSPNKFTKKLKDLKKTVVHVCSSPGLAKKCEDAGVDAVVAEGFEAGGHNGRDEITTMALIPQVVDAVKIPVIAAGGIVDGRTMAAAFCLGASAVQMGTRFMLTKESSAHDDYKKLLLSASSDSTKLMMKNLVPVRLFKNQFFKEVEALENLGASAEKLEQLLGKGRAKKGMLEGKLAEGELEVGQAVSMIKDLPSVSELVPKLWQEYLKTLATLQAHH